MMHKAGLFVWFRKAFKIEPLRPNNALKHPIREESYAMPARFEFTTDTDKRIYISGRAERD